MKLCLVIDMHAVPRVRSIFRQQTTRVACLPLMSRHTLTPVWTFSGSRSALMVGASETASVALLLAIVIQGSWVRKLDSLLYIIACVLLRCAVDVTCISAL